jgi:hypothetical protein
MPQPTDEEITNFVALQCEKWNARDKQGYLEAWKAIAPDGITFEDPVGTTPKAGWDMWSDMWDKFNPFSVEQRVDFLCLRAEEVALLMYHKAAYAGDTTEAVDIEVWKFSDGMAHVRCWWNPPASATHAASLKDYSAAGDRKES